MNFIHDIIWSPTVNDLFLTVSNELTFWQYQEGVPFRRDEENCKLSSRRCIHRTLPSSVYTLSERSYARKILTHPTYAKAVAWSYRQTNDPYFGVGTGTGNCVVTMLRQSDPKNPPDLVEVQLLKHKHCRPITTVAWNPVEPNLLALSLEKSKSDTALTIWDITAAVNFDKHRSARSIRKQSRDSNMFLVDVKSPKTASDLKISPIHELAQAESVPSIAWIPAKNKSLVAGLANKGLRVYDLRDSSRSSRMSDSRMMGTRWVEFDLFRLRDDSSALD